MKPTNFRWILASIVLIGAGASAYGGNQPPNSGYSINGPGGGVPTSRNPPATRPVPPATQGYPPGLLLPNRNLPPPPVQR